MNKAVDILAGLSVGSMLWWGFSGVPLWAPLSMYEGGDLRFVILFIAHIVPVVYASLRRVFA